MPGDGENFGQYYLEIGGVPCNIFTGPTGQDGHLEESTGPEGPRATVKFICNWRDRLRLRAGLVGTVDYQGGSVVRTDPYTYPLAAGDAEPFEGNQGVFPGRLFCTAITSTQGLKWRRDEDGEITGQAGWGYFEYAVLTAEFTCPGYQVSTAQRQDAAFRDLTNTPYCISKLQASGEVFSPPTGALRWSTGSRSGQALVDANTGIVRPRLELSVTRVRMPIVPVALFDQFIGTTNNAPFTVGDYQVGVEAALFMGYNVEPKSDPFNGGLIFDIELLWLVNGYLESKAADASWNWYLDPSGSWERTGYPNANDSYDPPFPSDAHEVLLGDALTA